MMRLDKLPNQRKNEHVEIFLRRHWLEVFNIIITGTLLLAIPTGIAIAFWSTVSYWMNHEIIGPLLALGIVIYIMSVWLLAIIEFTDYYLDTWIVTNERIINIEQLGLFNRHASELHLTNIQDVTAEIEGFLHTVFNFGHVYIQTAGETTRFNFKQVADPDKIKDKILDLVEEDKARHGHGEGIKQKIEV